LEIKIINNIKIERRWDYTKVKIITQENEWKIIFYDIQELEIKHWQLKKKKLKVMDIILQNY
jgi:hypothetical protein